jgi:hypothetical protein
MKRCSQKRFSEASFKLKGKRRTVNRQRHFFLLYPVTRFSSQLFPGLHARQRRKNQSSIAANSKPTIARSQTTLKRIAERVVSPLASQS